MADYITLDEIQLPKDLEWTDEAQWSSVQQSLGYGMTGALFIQEGVKQSGRFISLTGKDDMAWIPRETVTALLAKQTQPGLVMSLTLSDDRTFTVMFRQAETPVDVSSVKGFEELQAGAWFRVNALKFMEVTVG